MAKQCVLVFAVVDNEGCYEGDGKLGMVWDFQVAVQWGNGTF